MYVCTLTAPYFTEVAAQVGVNIPEGAMMITSFGILYNPVMALIFLAFLSGNFLWMGIVIVIYFAMYILFKKNKQAVWSFLEGENPDTPKEKVVA